MVFVFATGAMMNANSSNEEVTLNDYFKMSHCDEVYFEVTDAVTSMTGSEYVGISAAIAAESACLDEEIDIIEY
ncbi:hypothetical protein SAMN05216503_3430 [Polaribacter sp. KT25b]|nr:hypothetical protein SAMN05216503_3430 [Polaribacter sp. KT25b]